MINNKVNTNLNIVKDSYSTDSLILFTSYVMNKYSLVFESLKIKFNEKNEVIDKLIMLDNSLVRNDFDVSLFYNFTILESDSFLITFNSYDNKKKCEIQIYHNSYSKVKPLFDLITSYKDKQDEIFVSILSYFMAPSKLLNSVENIKSFDDFAVDSLEYYPYIDVKELFIQYTMSDSNILLLSGTPGTGKTRLGDLYMKYLLEEFENGKLLVDDNDDFPQGVKVCYIKNEDVLATDELWNELKENEVSLVFLDDLDYALLPRTQQVNSTIDSDKNKFISHLLSFTDGIFESGSKTKFIITTNRNVSEIDKAVLRKGRTFDIIQLRELYYEEAQTIWVNSNLPIDDFKKQFHGEKILQADLGSAIKTLIASSKKEIVLKPYILEDGISLYNKTKNSKKVGLNF